MALRRVAALAPDQGEFAVIAHGVHKRFGGQSVLRAFSLTIGDGEFVALLGRSGSGKSTFLKVAGGLDNDAQGDIRVAARRAIVFQEARLMPWLDVLRNVTLGLPPSPATTRLALEALNDVGLPDHIHSLPRTLSGGEAQRVAIARALVRSPQLLLLDEPFGALDALTRIHMQQLLKKVYRKYRPAVLLITHDVDEAILLADRVAVLTDGGISLDKKVDVAGSRLRSDPRFILLRNRLLAELGVKPE